MKRISPLLLALVLAVGARLSAQDCVDLSGYWSAHEESTMTFCMMGECDIERQSHTEGILVNQDGCRFSFIWRGPNLIDFGNVELFRAGSASCGNVSYSGAATEPIPGVVFSQNTITCNGTLKGSQIVFKCTGRITGTYQGVGFTVSVSQNSTWTASFGRELKPPVILTEPQDQTAGLGGAATFAVSAGGSCLNYQWYFNNTPITGARSATYTVRNAKAANAGDYSVLVSNFDGSIFSRAARLTVLDLTPPTVTIATPLANARILTNAVRVTGTARDNVALSGIAVSVNNGPFKPVGAGGSWSGMVDLAPGTNVLVARAIDTSGNVGFSTPRRVFRVVLAPLIVRKGGEGTISPNYDGRWLEVDRAYSMTATAGQGFLFSNWVNGAGATLTNRSTLRFVMASNLVLRANFAPNPFLALKGSYVGLFQPPDEDAFAPTNAGALALTLTDRGSFSGTVRLAGRSHAFSGAFDLALHAATTIRPSGLAPLTLQLDLLNEQTITGQISTAGWMADALAVRRATAKTNTFAGRYSMLVMGRHDANDAPPGDSALAVTVSGPSSVSLSGMMADGSPVTLATGHSDTGSWPCYASLNSGRGVALGWMTCANQPLAQVLRWAKMPDATARLYPAGFRETRDVALRRYQPPAPKAPAATWTERRLLVGGGNLPAPLEAEVLVTNNLIKRVSGTLSNFSLTITNSNGRFGGSFTHPVTRNATPLRGVLVQGLPWVTLGEQVTVGGGWFVGTNQGGWLWLEPRR